MREDFPDREHLAGLLEAEVTSDDAGVVLDPLLETALARSGGDPEAPLHPALGKHAKDQSRAGVELFDVLAEYTALRTALHRLWERDAPAPLSLLRELNVAIDEAMLATVREYRINADMLSMICHDLRNPLQSLMLCGTQLERTENVDPKIKKPAEVILRATQRLNRMIEDLALFAAMDFSGKQPAIGAHDPRAIIDELIDAHRAAAKEKKLTLEARVEEPARAVVLDRNRVLRALHHLIQHAMKVTPAGSTIIVGVRTEERATHFRVEHGGRSARSLDFALARALISASGASLDLQRDNQVMIFSVFG